MKLVAVLLPLLLSAVVICAAHEGHDHDHHEHDDEETVESGPTKVVSLDNTNFNTHIQENEFTLVEFFAPWCGHCKSLVPEYDAASILLEGIASVAKVDCPAHRELCSNYNIQGFPTIKLFRNDGSDPVDFEQGRNADAIYKFVLKQTQPAYTVLADHSALTKFTTESAFSVVGFIRSDDKTNIDNFVTWAKAYRVEYDFALVHNEDLTKQFTASTPHCTIFRKFDEPQVSYTGSSFTAQALEEFLVENSLPLLGTIGPENYQKYVERGYPLFWMFVDFSKHQSVLDTAKTVAKDFTKSVSFVQLDGIKWADHAKSFGITDQLPGLVLEDKANKKNYLFPLSNAITVDSLHQFVQGFVDGTLQPTIRSEPIPEKNDGPVKIVVGKTFDSIVLDTTKDVMLEVYAPWCGHCKALTPKYEKLGEAFKDVPSIVIAKLDGTENDAPVNVKGFPTIVFFPANAKENPITYEGDRTETAMEKFIRKHSFTLAGGKTQSTKSKDEL